MKRSKGNKRIVIVVIAAVLAIVLLLAAAWVFTRPTYVFSVNGVKVEREELIYAMGEHRYTVAAEIEEKYGADSGDADFWDREFDGETANEMLRRTAAEAIVVDKVQLLTAKQHGIRVKLSYSLVETARQRENEERAEGGGEIYYGPDELSYHTFYINYLMGIQEELKEKLRGTVIAVPAEELQATYQEHKAEYVDDEGEQLGYDEVKDLIYTILEDEYYDAYIQTLVAQATVKYYDAYQAVTVMDSLDE